MQAIFWLLDTVLSIVQFLVFIWVVLSWLVSFNVIRGYNPTFSAIMDALYRVTAPALRPIQRIVPNIGGLDFSPLILLVLLQFARILLRTSIAPWFGVYGF